MNVRRLLCIAQRASSCWLVSRRTVYGQPPRQEPSGGRTDPNSQLQRFHSLIREISLSSGGKDMPSASPVVHLVGVGWEFEDIHPSGRSGVGSCRPIRFLRSDGKRISLDTTSASAEASGDSVSLALKSNQASEVSRSVPQVTARNTEKFRPVPCLPYCCVPTWVRAQRYSRN